MENLEYDPNEFYDAIERDCRIRKRIRRILIVVFIPIWLPIKIIWMLIFRNTVLLIRNKHTKELESLTERTSENARNIFGPDDRIITGDFHIKRQLSLGRFYRVKRLHFMDGESYFKLSPYAYELENKCPKCGKNLYALYIVSPPESWAHLAGRAGYYIFCPGCNECIDFHLTMMN